MRRSRREEEFDQAPAPPLGGALHGYGHVRELQLLLAHFWDVVFWVIRRGFQLEVFFITEQDIAEQSSPKEV